MTGEGASVDVASLEKLGEGYEAEIFAWEDGQALRLFREGHERSIEPERIAIPAALAGGIPAPRIGEAMSLAGREGSIMERIDGENLLDLVGRKPWLMPREAWSTGRIHARLNALPAPDGLATAHERVREWIANVEVPPHLTAIAEETLSELEGGDRFCHSDFHPGNILLEPGGRRVVIDWGFCAAGPIESDVARSTALLWLGEPLDPSPALKVITRFFRPIATGTYLRAYRSVARFDTELMWRWVVVRAIEHLAIVRAISPPDAGIPDPVAGSRSWYGWRSAGRAHRASLCDDAVEPGSRSVHTMPEESETGMTTAPTTTATVLVVEDEEALLLAMAHHLRREGYEVLTAARGDDGLRMAREGEPDVIVLDLMLPGVDGMGICRALRRDTRVPIIMVTALGGESDRVAGLDTGADDYLSKPFGMRELLARVRALLRRAPMRRDAPPEDDVVRSGDLEVNRVRREVRRGGELLRLKPREFELLLFLLRHPGQVLSREHILESVWEHDFNGDARTVDVHMRWLRQKIEPDAGNPRRIRTVRGSGYLFEG